MRSRVAPRGDFRAGFTLVEVLVVVAITGNDIERSIWQAMGTRSGGETVAAN